MCVCVWQWLRLKSAIPCAARLENLVIHTLYLFNSFICYSKDVVIFRGRCVCCSVSASRDHFIHIIPFIIWMPSPLFHLQISSTMMMNECCDVVCDSCQYHYWIFPNAYKFMRYIYMCTIFTQIGRTFLSLNVIFGWIYFSFEWYYIHK